MIKPVSGSINKNQYRKEQIKKDLAISTVLGSALGTHQTVSQLKQTAKETNIPIKEMVKMFDSKVKFLTSTSLFKNIAIQSIQFAGLFALSSLVINAFNKKK